LICDQVLINVDTYDLILRLFKIVHITFLVHWKYGRQQMTKEESRSCVWSSSLRLWQVLKKKKFLNL